MNAWIYIAQEKHINIFKYKTYKHSPYLSIKHNEYCIISKRQYVNSIYKRSKLTGTISSFLNKLRHCVVCVLYWAGDSHNNIHSSHNHNSTQVHHGDISSENDIFQRNHKMKDNWRCILADYILKTTIAINIWWFVY